MATPNTTAVPVSPDTLITVKVSYNAGIRRFKLPLRELGPNVLPGKLRTALSIPEGQKVVIERYSDSAGAFIILDSTIPSVYKQLYRAAKAKLKLRLKATVEGAAGTAAVSTLPTYSQISLLSPLPDNPTLAAAPVAPTSAPAPPVELDTSKINKAVADAIMNYVKSEDYNNKLQKSISEEVAKQSRAASVASSVAPSMCSLPAFAPTENRGIAVERLLNTPSVPNGFKVYCNNCNASVDGAHYHCSSCDGGDFDLCEACVVGKGEHCSQNHWLIKRYLKDGQFVSSTTEAAPKSKASVVEKAPAFQSRTCNSCVASLPEECFVTCAVCEDYDVCLPCLSTSKHGHHPLHAFEPATKDTPLQASAQDLLAPGRGVKHHAICDGCDATIYGVRHKCLECPDWDYCSTCYKSAELLHTGHRFVPLYEAYNLCTVASKIVHTGIYCDGHLCVDKPRWIVGDRYHCAVCNDVDFCAMCEAHPGNAHNHTHPLIKLKTPVRNLTCATEATEPDLPVPHTSLLGDVRGFQRDNLRPTTHAATQVQTVADVEPEMENLIVNEKAVEAVEEDEFLADFVTDTVEDGTLMAPSQKFSQTWTLKNTGRIAWPAGVSVRYVGGDQMFGTGSEDEFGRTILLEEVAVGETAEFTVNLIAPEFPRRRCISYWRLSAPDGQRFGHKLWCDIEVEEQDEPIIVKEEQHEDTTAKGEESLHQSVSSAASEMVFPTLDKESVILEREVPIPAEAEESQAETDAESTSTAPIEVHGVMHSPAWTLAMSEGDDMTSDVATSEDDVESLMLDDEDYEVLETSDDDGYNRVI